MRKLQIFLVGIVVLVFLVSLEVVYVYRNRPELVMLGIEKLLEHKFRSSEEENKTDMVLWSLVNLAEIRREGKEGKVELPSVSGKAEIESVYQEILKTTDYEELFKPHSEELVKLFYRLGLEAYKLEEHQLVVPLWELALSLAPEWGYFHQELANYYLTQNQKQKSLKIIESCLLREHASRACQQYLDDHWLSNTPVEVGSWGAEIDSNLRLK